MRSVGRTVSPAFLEKLGGDLRKQRQQYIDAHIRVEHGRAIAYCDCRHRVPAETAKLVRTEPYCEEKQTGQGTGLVPVQPMRVVCSQCVEGYVRDWRDTKTFCEDLVKRKKGGEKKAVRSSTEEGTMLPTRGLL